MKIFKEFPEGQVCPVCKKNDNKNCCLIAKEGTNDDGGLTYEAAVVHLDCIDLMYNAKLGFFYQKISNELKVGEPVCFYCKTPVTDQNVFSYRKDGRNMSSCKDCFINGKF